MGKTNWKRVFLGGVVTGIVIIILGFASFVLLRDLYNLTLEALEHPDSFTAGMYIMGIVSSLIFGILIVWLYSAIRPRLGAGPKTALIAGLFIWVIGSLFPSISLGSMGFLPANFLMIDVLTNLVIYVVATMVGAWIYKEQE